MTKFWRSGRYLALTIVLASLSAPICAGPFGINKGQPIGSLKGLRRGDGDGVYTILVPLPNAEFEAYGVLATPEDGVCRVWGMGRDHPHDRYGMSVRSAFDTLRAALTTKYHIGRISNYLKPDALFKEDNEWVMAIKQNERVYASYWNSDNSNDLGQGISIISLEIKASFSDNAYLELDYMFDNFESCEAHLATKTGDGL